MALDPSSVDRPRRMRPGVRVAVVVSEFHEQLTGAMLDSARDELESSGLAPGDLQVAWVPGAFELPIVARRYARRDDVDAVLCFGLVLKGETSHDHWVAHAATEGILQASLETDTPILFGVLTCNNLDQAKARALPAEKGGGEDKGREVARAAIGVLAALDMADGISAPQGSSEEAGR